MKIFKLALRELDVMADLECPVLQ